MWVGGLSPLGSLAPAWSHPVAPAEHSLLPGRLQKEVRLAQKADYSAQRAASPPPYDKILVRRPRPSLQDAWRWGQARALLEGLLTRQGTPASWAGGLLEPSLHACPCSFCSPGTRRWLRAPRCTTTSTKSSRCSPWRSKQPWEQAADPAAAPCSAINWGAVNHPLGFTPLSAPSPPRHKEEPKLPDSASSDEENEDGDFTVYECPGLAPVWRAQGGPWACRQGSSTGLGRVVPCKELFKHVLHQPLRWSNPCALARSHWSSPVGKRGCPAVGAWHGAGPWGSARATLGRATLTSLPCRDMGTLGSSWGLPSAWAGDSVTPQGQGGLSWLAGDPGEGQLLTVLGTKSTKRPERSLSHGNGCGAWPSGPRLRVIIRSLQAH